MKFENRRYNNFKKAEDVSGKENILIGRNPVLEALKAGRTIEKLYVAKNLNEGTIRVIIAKAKEKKAIITEVERKVLDEMSGNMPNQGVIAFASDYKYYTVDDILGYAKEKNEVPFLIILDEIEDPHNLGSIIRSANVLGAHGVIIPSRRSALITATTSKASAGAVEYTKVAKVTNINQTIAYLKEKGLWVIGADMSGEECSKSNLTGPCALVIGNEGSGLSRLVRENCDMLVKINVEGQVDSLNASVAAGILMYEIKRQRILK